MSNSTLATLLQHLDTPIPSHHALLLFVVIVLVCFGIVFVVALCCYFFNVGGIADCIRRAERTKQARLESIALSPSDSEEPLLSPGLYAQPQSFNSPQSSKAKHGLRSPPVVHSTLLDSQRPPTFNSLLPSPPPPQVHRPRGHYFTGGYNG